MKHKYLNFSQFLFTKTPYFRGVPDKELIWYKNHEQILEYWVLTIINASKYSPVTSSC